MGAARRHDRRRYQTTPFERVGLRNNGDRRLGSHPDTTYDKVLFAINDAPDWATVSPVTADLHSIVDVALVGPFGKPGRYSAVLNRDSEDELTLLTRGRENDLSTPSSFIRLQRDRSHSITVVGVEDQRLIAAPSDSLVHASHAHQIGRDGLILQFGDIPGDDLAAPNDDHQIEGHSHTSHCGGQVGDVPAPHLIRTCRFGPWHVARLLW